jgi:hypothetical protein
MHQKFRSYNMKHLKHIYSLESIVMTFQKKYANALKSELYW